jgi:HK97 family phage major capsid protein
MDQTRNALNAELRSFLSGAPNRAVLETRDTPMNESTNSQGGYTVPPGFASEVIRLVKEFDGLVGDAEDLETPHGAPWGRPQVSSLVASSANTTEGTQVTSYGGDATGTMTQVTFAGVQQFGLTPTYVCRLAASNALFQDSNVDLVDLLASAASQALAREVASVANLAVYANATVGQEASLSTLSATSLAKLLALVEPGYHKVGGGSKFYMSPTDAATVFGSTSGILANSDGLHLFGFPVVITNACTNYVASTVSGPVFGNLSQAFTLRRAPGIQVQVLRERYSDWLQTGVNVFARMDFAARGQATALAYSK